MGLKSLTRLCLTVVVMGPLWLLFLVLFAPVMALKLAFGREPSTSWTVSVAAVFCVAGIGWMPFSRLSLLPAAAVNPDSTVRLTARNVLERCHRR